MILRDYIQETEQMRSELRCIKREQERTVKKNEINIEKIERKVSKTKGHLAFMYDTLIADFKKYTGIKSVIGSDEIKNVIYTKGLKKKRKEIIAELMGGVRSERRRPGKQRNITEKDFTESVFELIETLICFKAIRIDHNEFDELDEIVHHIIPSIEDEIEGLSVELFIEREIDERRKYALRELKQTQRLINNYLSSLKRAEEFSRTRSKANPEGGKRGARREESSIWLSKIDARKENIETLNRELMLLREETKSKKETLRRFFAQRGESVQLMVSILRNIKKLCHRVVKYEIKDVSSFEINVAAREYQKTKELLDDDDPLRDASEESVMNAFSLLASSENILSAYNIVLKNKVREEKLMHRIDHASLGLEDLKNTAKEMIEKKVAEIDVRRKEMRIKAAKIRADVRLAKEQLQLFYKKIKSEFRVRTGISRFPGTHLKFWQEIFDENKMRAAILLERYLEHVDVAPRQGTMERDQRMKDALQTTLDRFPI